MFSKGVFVTLPLVFSLLPALVLSQPTDDDLSKREAEVNFQSFQKILGQVDPSSLHSALHEYSPKKFEHGMFREDKTAMEAIHKDNAPLATSIINLAKRAVGNGTVTSSTPPSVTSATTVVESPSPSASDSNSDTASVTTVPSTETATSEPASTSSDTNAAPTSDSTTPPITVTSTSTGQSSAADASSIPVSQTTTSSAAQESQSTGSVVTTTDSFGVIVVTTIGGGASTVESSSPSATDSSTTSPSQSSTITRKLTTSKSIHTTVLSDGSKSTVTAITVVPGDDSATPTGDAGVAQGSGTGTASPGLQTGVAVRTGNVMKELMCMVGGAVGVAMLM